MENKALQNIPVEKLVCRPQIRESSGFTDEEIAGLAQSIAESGGIHQPLLARRDGEATVVLDGHRRLLAAKKAGLTTVPVIVVEKPLTDAEVLHRALVLDAQRVGLSPIERAKAIDALMSAAGWSAAQVAVKLGISPASVSKLLSLLVLPEDVQRQVSVGQLAMSTAYELAKLPDAVDRNRLLQEASNGRITRDEVVKRRKAAVEGRAVVKPRRPTRRRERVVIPIGQGCSVSVSAPQLSVENIVIWLSCLIDRITSVGCDGRSLDEVVKAVAGVRK